MTESFNRNAYVRVGVAAIAVFVALLLVGAARGEGTGRGRPRPARPPTPATPGGPPDRGRFGGPDRRGDGGVPGGGRPAVRWRRRACRTDGGVAPGGGLVPEDGRPRPAGGSSPAPGTTTAAGRRHERRLRLTCRRALGSLTGTDEPRRLRLHGRAGERGRRGPPPTGGGCTTFVPSRGALRRTPRRGARRRARTAPHDTVVGRLAWPRCALRRYGFPNSGHRGGERCVRDRSRLGRFRVRAARPQALCRETGRVRATETVGDRALILIEHGPSRTASRGRVGVHRAATGRESTRSDRPGRGCAWSSTVTVGQDRPRTPRTAGSPLPLPRCSLFRTPNRRAAAWVPEQRGSRRGSGS